MIRSAKMRLANMRLVLAALVTVGILHICATLAAPGLTGTSAYRQLAHELPLHKMTLLPPVAPGTQPLRFLAPDARYAMCRFDTSNGAVTITANLPDAGWTLSLHSPEGNNFYASAGTADRKNTITLVLVPSGDRFLGLTPEAVGRPRTGELPLTLQAHKGIAVVRGPDKGLAYRAQVERDLRRARCSSGPS